MKNKTQFSIDEIVSGSQSFKVSIEISSKLKLEGVWLTQNWYFPGISVIYYNSNYISRGITNISCDLNHNIMVDVL